MPSAPACSRILLLTSCWMIFVISMSGQVLVMATFREDEQRTAALKDTEDTENPGSMDFDISSSLSNPLEVSAIEAAYSTAPASGFYPPPGSIRYLIGGKRDNMPGFLTGFVGARGRRFSAGFKRQDDMPPGFMGARGKRTRLARDGAAELAYLAETGLMGDLHQLQVSETALRKPNGKKSGSQLYQNGFLGVRG